MYWLSIHHHLGAPRLRPQLHKTYTFTVLDYETLEKIAILGLFAKLEAKYARISLKKGNRLSMTCL
jgi:hypothetical protein